MNMSQYFCTYVFRLRRPIEYTRVLLFGNYMLLFVNSNKVDCEIHNIQCQNFISRLWLVFVEARFNFYPQSVKHMCNGTHSHYPNEYSTDTFWAYYQFSYFGLNFKASWAGLVYCRQNSFNINFFIYKI